MKKYGLMVFWGAFLLFFHINIGPVTLVPPFFALLLVAAGLHGLRKWMPSPALTASLVLCLLLSVAQFARFLWNFFVSTPIAMPEADRMFRYGLGVNTLLQGMEMALFFLLFLACAAHYQIHGLIKQKDTLDWNSIFYLVTSTALLVFGATCIVLPADRYLYFVLLAGVLTIYRLFVLYSIVRNLRRLDNAAPPTPMQ